MIATMRTHPAYRNLWETLLTAAATDDIHERRVCRLLNVTHEELKPCLVWREPDYTGESCDHCDRLWALYRVRNETLATSLPERAVREFLCEDSA